jgi:hypothetical protein
VRLKIEYFADQIIQRFDATIAALFFGHTHQDEFQIAYSTPAAPTADTAVMVSYVAPALTPTSGNPSRSCSRMTILCCSAIPRVMELSVPNYHFRLFLRIHLLFYSMKYDTDCVVPMSSLPRILCRSYYFCHSGLYRVLRQHLVAGISDGSYMGGAL